MAPSSHFPISVATLWPTDVVGLDLFLLDKSDDQFRLFKGADYPLVLSDLEKLQQRQIKTLYVAATNRTRYQSYLRHLVDNRDSSPAMPMEVRIRALAEVVRDVLEEAFDSQDTEKCVAQAVKLGSATAEILSNDEFTTSELFRVLHHDYATFTHSANVGLYAGMLAKEMQMSAEEIESIVIGGLLHDLGKLEIDDRILGKPARLNQAELDEIHRHPTLGFRKLAGRIDLTEGQLLMVYQHHERLDGGGYPVGIPDGEIHAWAKLCGVVDVFEALTSFRPYRRPMSKRQALELMEKESGTAFEPESLACWTAIIRAHYPN